LVDVILEIETYHRGLKRVVGCKRRWNWGRKNTHYTVR